MRSVFFFHCFLCNRFAPDTFFVTADKPQVEFSESDTFEEYDPELAREAPIRNSSLSIKDDMEQALHEINRLYQQVKKRRGG